MSATWMKYESHWDECISWLLHWVSLLRVCHQNTHLDGYSNRPAVFSLYTVTEWFPMGNTANLCNTILRSFTALKALILTYCCVFHICVVHVFVLIGPKYLCSVIFPYVKITAYLTEHVFCIMTQKCNSLFRSSSHIVWSPEIRLLLERAYE